MLRKNEERVSVVKNLGMDGEGVLVDDNTVVFVPFTLAGEKIKYKVLKATNKCAYGKMLEVYTPAEERVRPECPYFFKCGGCQLQHIRYSDQLKIKENKVATCFKKIANLEVAVKQAVKGDSSYRYRNKLQLPVGNINGENVIGFYAENSHRIIPIDDCVINPTWTKNIISAFKKYLNNAKLKGYNEEDCSGDIREITVKEISGNLIITVVSLIDNLPQLDYLIETIKDEVKLNFSLYLNVNTNAGNYVYGEEFKLLYGEPEYSSEMLGVKYKIGVRSFMQVNTSVCSRLYSAVSVCVQADENTTVIDAYSGAGLMTAILAKKAKKAIGIEIVKEAVDIANDLAKENNLASKITNYCGKCEDLLPKIIEQEKQNGENITLILDPPRKGVEQKVIEAIIKSDIDKIVYVSCKPSTLARDVGLIVGSLETVDGEVKRSENFTPRYAIEQVKPFEMFAETKHVETLCVLKKI